MALIGIFQFLLPILNVPSFCVQQWWIKDYIVRASAFSYEPSYFASYLLLGWGLLFTIKQSSYTIFSKKKDTLLLGIISLGIILSTSRIVILLLFFILLGSFVKTKNKIQISLMLAGLVILCLSIYLFLSNKANDAYLLFSGTGIEENSSYSLTERLDNMKIIYETIKQRLFRGCGLGAIAEHIAFSKNEIPASIEELKLYEGNCIILEMILASGLFGVIPLVFLVKDLYVSSKKVCSLTKSLIQTFYIGYLFAFIIFFIALQYNQNILRTYLWIHYGLILGFLRLNITNIRFYETQ